MPMETVYEVLFKAEMLDEEREEKRKWRRGRAVLSIPPEASEPLHSRLSRFSGSSTRIDGWRENRILQRNRGTSGKCPTRRNPEADNHLLLEKRPSSPRKSTCLSHPQSYDKCTDSFLIHKWQGSTMELHEPSSFTRTTSCPSHPRDEVRTIS